MRTLFVIAATAASLFAAGEPTNVMVGSLNCGARLIGTDQVQRWCHRIEGAAGWILVHNAISKIEPGTVTIDVYTSGADQVKWKLSRVENGSVQYQIDSGEASQVGVFGADVAMQGAAIAPAKPCMVFGMVSPDPLDAWPIYAQFLVARTTCP